MSKVIFDAPLPFIKGVVKGVGKYTCESSQKWFKDIVKYICDSRQGHHNIVENINKWIKNLLLRATKGARNPNLNIAFKNARAAVL